MNKTGWWTGLIVLVAVGLLYQGLSYYERHREATLLKRADTYWSALAAHDLETAYHLEAETANGLLRPDEVELVREWGVRLVRFKFGEINYYDHYAEIMVTRDLTYPDSESGKIRTKPPIKDLWVFFKGEWYHGAPEKGGSGIRKR